MKGAQFAGGVQAGCGERDGTTNGQRLFASFWLKHMDTEEDEVLRSMVKFLSSRSIDSTIEFMVE